MNTMKKQMPYIKSQGGWTIWSMMFVLSTIGFLAYMAMQLVPVYESNSNVKNALRTSVQNNDVQKITRGQIIKGMRQQLYLDGGSDYIDYKTDLKVTRDRSKLVITVDYERRIPLFANISVVVDFKPTLECGMSGGCEEGSAE